MTTDRCSHGELMTDACAACDGHTKAEDSASASVPAGGTPGGLAGEKVDEQQAAVNPTDRPDTEPRTKAGQAFEDALIFGKGKRRPIRDWIVDIEAEAAEGAAPQPPNAEIVALIDALEGAAPLDPYHVPCERAHPGYGHEEWIGLSVSERIDRSARHYPNDNCGDLDHDRILEAWYVRAEALLGAAPLPVDDIAGDLWHQREGWHAMAAPRAEGLDEHPPLPECDHAADCICIEFDHTHCCGNRRVEYLAASHYEAGDYDALCANCGCLTTDHRCEPAAPRAEGLDVERLRQALATVYHWAMPEDEEDDAEEVLRVNQIAAEYARLSRPSDERDSLDAIADDVLADVPALRRRPSDERVPDHTHDFRGSPATCTYPGCERVPESEER